MSGTWHICKYLSSQVCLTCSGKKMVKRKLEDIPLEKIRWYDTRDNKTIPDGQVRTLWYLEGDGYLWPGKILREVASTDVPKRFLSPVEKTWRWFEVGFEGFKNDYYAQVDVAETLLSDWDKPKVSSKKRKVMSDSLDRKRENYRDRADPHKDQIRRAILAEFEKFPAGTFFALEGPEARMLKHIEAHWSYYPSRMDIANWIPATCKKIEQYVQTHKMHWVQVHPMKDSFFFEQHAQRQYNGIWIDRMCSNPPDQQDWRTLISGIINNRQLGLSKGVLALTFSLRSGKKVHNEQVDLNKDRMIRLIFEILNSQKLDNRGSEGFWRYMVQDMTTKSYPGMCTMWFHLAMVPCLF